MSIGRNGSQAGCSYCFESSEVVVVPELDIRATSITGFFDNCKKLETIRAFGYPTNSDWNAVFANCKALKNITIVQPIYQSVTFATSPLTVESMISIITHLYNWAGKSSEYKYSLTLTSACKTALEEAGAIIEYTDSEGITTMKTGAEYINLIGWTLK